MFGLIGNIGPWELVLVLVIVLVIFGPGKLPKVGESLGKALSSFKKAREDDEEVTESDSNKEK
ncbi:MAG: twin-arginine translocase TatA/TatE family subunit [Syntrophomonadaceae bacterium]|nr:twin-arginine translocase TatA/TatE family subunit [Syntrophomonadaceae bacterium]